MATTHRITQPFEIPRRPTVIPPAADCTPEQLLNLGAHAAQDSAAMWALTGSSEHVAAICVLACELELQRDTLAQQLATLLEAQRAAQAVVS